jgi:hypothetical protein
MLSSILIPDYVRVAEDLKRMVPPLSYSQRLEILKYDRFCAVLQKQLQDHGVPEFFPHLLGVVCVNDDCWGERLNVLSINFKDYSINYLEDLEERIQVFFEVPEVPEEALEDPDLHFHMIRRRIIWSNIDEPEILSWEGDQLSRGFLNHPESEIAISLYREEFRDGSHRLGLFILKP